MALPALPALPALFGVATLLLGAFVCLVSVRHLWRTAALARADPVDRIDGVAEGALVRVSGAVDAERTLTAPFSGVDCVAHRAVVEERRPGAFFLPTDVTIHEPTRSTAFAVRTPHARVSVADPVRTVALDSTVVATVGPDDDPPERIARYERETDGLGRETVWTAPPAPLVPVTRTLSLGRRRYSERRASPGDDVTVAGRVRDGRLDPLVVSTGSAGNALRRLSTTSLAGLLIGAVAVVLGAAILVLG
ncbi:hypothetical protein [Haloplanus rubicundus]|uniref:Uncharacterized protein n=1 Tax=Haloplanus rubicundus TaxID=1547898 RepID=A0A345EDT8_9EURY|nr:hypothetical protein [Haloplanus rubicundus]AXG10360.1 hypothetical protein DU484_11180 [Haloplanus rubicundus]